MAVTLKRFLVIIKCWPLLLLLLLIFHHFSWIKILFLVISSLAISLAVIIHHQHPYFLRDDRIDFGSGGRSLHPPSIVILSYYNYLSPVKDPPEGGFHIRPYHQHHNEPPPHRVSLEKPSRERRPVVIETLKRSDCELRIM